MAHRPTAAPRVSLTWWRLTWRQQRWELAILIGGALLLAGVMAFVAWQTALTREGLGACYARPEPLTSGCRSLVDIGNVWTALTGTLIGVATVAPFGVGILLGAPLLAREIEKRTAPMAWSLSRSRQAWLVGRALPLAALVTVALVLVGLASSLLQDAAFPEGRGFMDYGSRGIIVPARGIALFGIGVGVGLTIGRVLPAILVTGLLSVAVLGAIEYGRNEAMRAEAKWIEVGTDVAGADTLNTISMVYDSGFVDDATGEVVTYEEAYERFPEDFGPTGSGMPPGMTMTYLAIPPDRYLSFVVRESGVLLGVALVGGMATALVIGARRPE